MPQESAYTSLNQIPAGFKTFKLRGRNLDWGGGKFDKATQYLKKDRVYNFVYDEYNRSLDENVYSWVRCKNERTNSVTVFNVLNVIQDKKEREQLLKRISLFCKEQREKFNHDPVVIFQVYEGNRSGQPSEDTVQNNMKVNEYIPEIQAVFPDWEVQRQGNYIIV